jgi:hypothetical protein
MVVELKGGIVNSDLSAYEDIKVIIEKFKGKYVGSMVLLFDGYLEFKSRISINRSSVTLLRY